MSPKSSSEVGEPDEYPTSLGAKLDYIKVCVDRAVTLDSQAEDYGKAWRTYLDAVLGICHCLLSYGHEVHEKDVLERLYRVGGECLRRACELHEVKPQLVAIELKEADGHFECFCPASQAGQLTRNGKDRREPGKNRYEKQSEGASQKPRAPGQRPPLESHHKDEGKNSLSQTVWKRDKAILKLYHERLRYMNPSARSTLQLSLMRRMHENLDIARTKQTMLDQKTHSTAQRTQEHLSGSDIESVTTRSLSDQTEKPFWAFETKWFESDMLGKWIKNEDVFFRDRIKDRPLNEELLSYFVLKFSSSKDHPLGNCLEVYLTKFQEVYGDKGEESICLKDMLEDVHSFFERLYEYLLKVYPEFIGNDDAFLNMKTTVEHVVFTGLSQLILVQYHREHAARETQFARKMNMLAETATPQSIGIADKFCLMDEMDSAPSTIDGDAIGGAMPYERAVKEFRKVSNYRTPSGKLDCFVRTSDEICQSVADYWKTKGVDVTVSDDFAIGSDDLLPIFEYVVLMSHVPFILSEVMFVEEFLAEHLLSGAEGFVVATLQTALNYLETVIPL
jgi:hypothetical protein